MSAESCRGRGRPKTQPDDAQRDAIVDAARRLFLRKGYGATTTDDIAAQCRISKQTLYRLFQGKAGLFGAIVEASRPHWLELPVPDELPLQEALERIFRVDIGAKQDQERLSLVQVVLVEGHAYPELKQILNDCGAANSQSALAAWFEHQVSLGRLLLPCDALNAAKILLDMVFGALIVKYLDVKWPSNVERKAHTRNAIRIFLGGTLAEKQG